MISLQDPLEPYEIALAYGISVTVKPLTTTSMLVAQAAARKKVESFEKDLSLKKEIGLAPTDQDLGETTALFQVSLIQELALSHIIAWQGVSLNGQLAPLNPDTIKAVMELYPVGEKFLSEFTLKHMLLITAKNASRLSANGITHPQEGLTIAEGVKGDAVKPSTAPITAMPLKQ